MASILTLATRHTQLRDAALRFSTAYKKVTGGRAILIGGGATILLGQMARHTKDLDFNVSKMAPRDVKALNAAGIYVRRIGHTLDRFAATVPESEEDAKDAISIDLAVQRDINALIPFTREIEGVTVADERLLIVLKIQCLPERSVASSKKVGSDFEDVMWCASRLHEENIQLPESLSKQLSEDVIRNFFEAVARHSGGDREDVSMAKFFLKMAKIIPESFED
ncbi:hypothetical protein CC1G_02799 [Coprinopsis cinerea okayama7|uniref:Uncharacterized protein n=1 Tax=Coprinopsis cinerea (strain Okayama-7 / 130 / ATCC MYA-4618 / FGSC 9003) TaxID=240176 RepID=A8N029_COPC7|nr:hypothetical protein CC1G_02799 [Coprinopsis cinerea okayama7\|eukprot:XP_001828218.1 hypothetical protein CC1G_02799 [Coprinopsis cinerea okayama7\